MVHVGDLLFWRQKVCFRFSKTMRISTHQKHVLLGSLLPKHAKTRQNISETISNSRMNRVNVVTETPNKKNRGLAVKKNHLWNVLFFRNGCVSVHFLTKTWQTDRNCQCIIFLGGLRCWPLPPAQKARAVAQKQEIHAYPCYASPKIALWREAVNDEA